MKRTKKLHTLHPGGISIVYTPNMESMAREAYKVLKKRLKKRFLNLHGISYTEFSRGEVLPQIDENVRMKNVYLFYDFNGDSCHDSFVLSLTVSALQGSGASSITLVMPYMPFMRQDRKDRSRVPISAKAFINSYEHFEKVERTITLDMHAEQTQAAFDKRSDHLPGHVIFVPWIKERYTDRIDDIVIVGPDDGSEKRVTQIANRVKCRRAFFTKDRDGSNVEVGELHGANVSGKICIINDDILDTCSTVIAAGVALEELGASEVIISGTHAVFGDKNGSTAYNKLYDAGFEVVVTDSLHTHERDWLTVLPIARYMGYTILENNVVGGSVSKIITSGLPSD